jgi:hypothetical protein
VRLGHDRQKQGQVDAVPLEPAREGAAPVIAAHPHPEPAQIPQQWRVTSSVGAPAEANALHPPDGLGEDQSPFVRQDAPHEGYVPQRARRPPRQGDRRGDRRLEHVPAFPREAGKDFRMAPPQEVGGEDHRGGRGKELCRHRAPLGIELLDPVGVRTEGREVVE